MMNPLNTQIILKYTESNKYDIICMDNVTSTNTLLKDMAIKGAKDLTVVAAESQSAGRGRLNRTFFSPDNTGAYFSVLLRPCLDTGHAMMLTTSAAVAVALAIDEFSESTAEIKWVNDIYIRDKKVCGILTECSFDTRNSNIEWTVIGIGINILPPKNGFPSDIEDKAGYVVLKADDDIRNRIIGRVLYYLDKIFCEQSYKNILNEYRNRSWLDGKLVDVIDLNGTYPACVIGIDDEMRLVVQTDDGEIMHLISGEVSVRAKLADA